jgi:signal transduction histidine kinase
MPKLLRIRDRGVLGGVAAGISVHLRVPVAWVRVVFALLALMGGAGVIAYALLWIFVPAGDPGAVGRRPSTAERRQAYGIAAVGVALLIAGTALGFGDWIGYVLGPLGLAAIGGAFIWREADDARRARWRRTAAGFVGPTSGSWWRLIGGVVLVVGGLSVFALGQTDFTAVRSALIAVLLTLVGVAIITVPWWIRLVRDLGDERRERIRERERAEIAAHLHDSVLQTLALIQRQSGDNREVLRLARGQERELRSWLYGPAGYASPDGAGPAAPTTTFAAALANAAGEVEDTYAIAVSPVVVGDAAMGPHLAALLAASREAMVNAAKHAGVSEISVYAEIEGGSASVFVRDRGAGFDPAAVGTDRRGLAESVRGRMDRHGGTATVHSAPGAGTEVELTMPVDVDADSATRDAAGNGRAE